MEYEEKSQSTSSLFNETSNQDSGSAFVVNHNVPLSSTLMSEHAQSAQQIIQHIVPIYHRNVALTRRIHHVRLTNQFQK